jgi:hypothetical protein
VSGALVSKTLELNTDQKAIEEILPKKKATENDLT